MFKTGRACEKISYWAKLVNKPDPISDEEFWNLMYCPCMLDDPIKGINLIKKKNS